MLQIWDPSTILDKPEGWFFRSALLKFSQFERFPTIAELNSFWPIVDFEFASTKELRVRSFRMRKKTKSLDHLTYDEYICHKSLIPTREDNWHDFFNALVWYIFPQTKKLLYQKFLTFRLQRSNPQVRSAAEDWLTLLDEGGEIVVNSEQSVFFGHAILENAVLYPERKINAFKIYLNSESSDLAGALKADLIKMP